MRPMVSEATCGKPKATYGKRMRPIKNKKTKKQKNKKRNKNSFFYVLNGG